MIGFTPKDEQVNLSQEVRKILMAFVISNLFGVVAAAIQGNVDCEDYIDCPVPFLGTSACAPLAQSGLATVRSVRPPLHSNHELRQVLHGISNRNDGGTRQIRSPDCGV